MSSLSPSELRELIIRRFDQEELRNLCQDLDVDYDSLRGEGKAGKARELVALLQRRSRLDDLLNRLNELQPNDSAELRHTSLAEGPRPQSVPTKESTPPSAIEIKQLLAASSIRPQLRATVEALAKVLHGDAHQALGQAYTICDDWQQRFESALRLENPAWSVLAAFRGGVDFILDAQTLAELEQAATPLADSPTPAQNLPKELSTLAECWQAYVQYFKKGTDLHSGKFILKAPEVQNWFLARLGRLQPVLGSQAGNIVNLWQAIGAEAILDVPYLSQSLAELPIHYPKLRNLQLLLLANEHSELRPLADSQSLAGVCNNHGARVAAPTCAGFAVVEQGRRLSYMLPSLQVIEPQAGEPPTWREVQFFYQGEPLLEWPLPREVNDPTWPAIPLFSHSQINAEAKRLEITLLDGKQLATALKNKVEFAILGGMDAIFRDKWLSRDRRLQTRLLKIVEEQLRALNDCGIRIGIEWSGIPHPNYVRLVERLCLAGVIKAIGVNGVDELPQIVGETFLQNELDQFWLDEREIPKAIRAKPTEHAEYLTFLRARKLAQVTQARTLYVHTLDLDVILRRDTDPGALVHAQLADLKGKGLVIAALLERAYQGQWSEQLVKMPPALKPEAMPRLAQFAQDYETFEKTSNSANQILNKGYWIAASPSQYSVAVVPIMWPSAEDAMPEKLNTTGAGDMAFGAFFLLGGV